MNVIPHWNKVVARIYMLAFAIFLTIGFGNELSGGGSERCCAGCGAHTSCRKVCRLKCEEKKVQVTLWSSKTEEFCEYGPSKPQCKHCGNIESDPPDKTSPCTDGHPFVWRDWLPKVAPTIYTREKLMKKTVTKTVPTYRWVIEDLCETCAASAK